MENKMPNPITYTLTSRHTQKLMTRYSNQRGQTLVELLLALGLFAFIMTAVFALVFGGLTTGLRTEEQDYATMYAQEGLDAARSIRDTDWNAFAQNGTHGVVNSGSGWSWSGTNNETPYGVRKYTREITVEDVYRDGNNNIFTGSGQADFDYNTDTQYTYDSTQVKFTGTAAQLNKNSRLDNSVAPKELAGTETNLKALYHFNATSGAEANREGDELDIGVSGNLTDDDLGGASETNLKGLWHMNENTGTTTADTSGNNNTGYLDKFPQNGNLSAQTLLGIGTNSTNYAYNSLIIYNSSNNQYRIYYTFYGVTYNSIRYRETTDGNIPNTTGTNLSAEVNTGLGTASNAQAFSPWIERKSDNSYRLYYAYYTTYWQLAYRDTTDTNLPNTTATNIGATQTLMSIGSAVADQAFNPIIKRKPDNTYRIYYTFYNNSYSVVAYRDTTDTNLPNTTATNIGAQTLLGVGTGASDQARPSYIVQLPGINRYRLYYSSYGTYWRLAYRETTDTNLPQSGNIGSQLLLGIGTSPSDQAIDARFIDKPDGTYRIYYGYLATYWQLAYRDTNKIQPTWTTAGKFSNALSFDGMDDYVSVANESNFDFERTQAFSTEAWVKTSASSGEIVSKMNNASPYTGYELDITTGGVLHAYLISDWAAVPAKALEVTGSISVSNNAWHHVTLTYDGSSLASGLKLYVDGVLDPSITIVKNNLTAPNSILNNINLAIGSRNGQVSYFSGSIDEVAIYSAALTAPQITDHYNRGRAKDATVNNINGTIIGPVTTSPSAGANLNQALQFDGVDDYVSVGNVGTGIKSVEFWINRNGATQAGSILELNSTTGTVTISGSGNGTIAVGAGFTTPIIYVNGSSASAALASGWNHVAIIDGSAGGISALAVNIGKVVSGYFNGSLDEVAIWDKALTQADIWDHIGANLGYTKNSYATVKYNINPSKDTSYIDKFKEFVETATIPSGTSIDYQLSTDNCATMKYWDGTKWTNAGGWNDVRTINRYFDQLTPPGSTICLSARLNTTDANQTPVLDNVEIKYSQNQGGAKLVTGIDATQTTEITLSSVIGLPTSGSVTIDNEVITYAALSGNGLSGTVTRGANGTTAVLHLLNAEVKFTLADPHTKRVTSRVKWPSGFSFQDVSLTEYLTDWMYQDIKHNTQADFSAVEGSTAGLTLVSGTIYLSSTPSGPIIYTHAAIELGNKSKILKLLWEAAVPASGTLTLQIRSADSQANLATAFWCGQTACNGADAYPITGNGDNSIIVAADNQWIQYRLAFTSTIVNETPILDKITIQAKNLY